MSHIVVSSLRLGVGSAVGQPSTLVDTGDYDMLGGPGSEYIVSRDGYAQPPVQLWRSPAGPRRSVQFLGVLARDQAQEPFVSIPAEYGNDPLVSQRTPQTDWELNKVAHRILKEVAGYLQSTDAQDWKIASDKLKSEFYMDVKGEDSLPQILDAFLTLVPWMSERNLRQLVEAVIRLLSKAKTNVRGMSYRKVMVEFVRHHLREADYQDLLVLY